MCRSGNSQGRGYNTASAFLFASGYALMCIPAYRLHFDYLDGGYPTAPGCKLPSILFADNLIEFIINKTLFPISVRFQRVL